MKQTLTVFSPAKVNLQLEIGERRADGFHQAKSIMQALTLHDMVTVVLDDGVDAYLNPDGFSDFAIDVTCTTFEGIPELDVAPTRLRRRLLKSSATNRDTFPSISKSIFRSRPVLVAARRTRRPLSLDCAARGAKMLRARPRLTWRARWAPMWRFSFMAAVCSWGRKAMCSSARSSLRAARWFS